MKRATYFLVFLFYFQTGCFANPVPEKELSPRLIYNYHGQIDTGNTADNETISRWTVSGNLSVYRIPGQVVVKLDDVKTSVFNGPVSDLQNAQEKYIPEEAKVILQPFTVTRGDVENISIHFFPNEPLWSRNFKRGIASNLDLEIDLKKLKKSETNNTATFKETTIFGLCDVQYTVLSFDNEIKYERSIDYYICSKSPLTNPIHAFSHAKANDYIAQSVKTITMLERNGTYKPHHIVSTSHLGPEHLPGIPYSHYFDQITKLDLLDASEVEITIDISKITDKQELIYEVSEEPTSGRRAYETTAAGLTKQFLDNYDKYVNYFIRSPLQHVDLNNRDYIVNMFMALKRLDYDGFKHLEAALADRDDGNLNIFHMFFSLLPYVGTDASVKFIMEYISGENVRHNEIVATRLMAILPSYIKNYSEEILRELEPLLNLQNLEQQSAKNAGPLSFGTVLSKEHLLSEAKSNEYTQLFFNKFIGSESHQERMVYLLGLINMDEKFDLATANAIVTNTSECKYIRTLALAGFKHRFLNQPEKLYVIYWPILQNKSEPFELRVGALDLLLSVELSDEEFNSIIKKYSTNLNDPEDKQLANYLLTSLHSIQNSTEFYIRDYMTDKATEALKTTHIPGISTFATGNYRLAQHDDNIGSLLQTRIITDPSNNIIKMIQITYMNVAFTQNLNRNLYINFDGVLDSVYATNFLKKISDASSVPELVKLLKDYNFDIKTEDTNFHIDVVLFSYNVAVYAVHFDSLDREKLRTWTDDLAQLAAVTLSAEYPFINYLQMPSDLGTPLQCLIIVEDVTYHDIEKGYINYRSTWNSNLWFESYNPFVDTKIASYIYSGLDKSLNLNFTLNSPKSLFSWVNRKDSFVMYKDNIMGTSVEDEDILKQYCEKCDAYIDVSTDISRNRISNFEAFGFKANMTHQCHEFGPCMDSVAETFYDFLSNKLYRTNIDALPFAGPVMLLAHVITSKTVFDTELSRSSYHSIPFYDEDTETTITIDTDLNFKLNTRNPINRKVFNFSIEVENKKINETKALSGWNADYGVVWEPEYTDNNGKKNSVQFQTFNLKFLASDDVESYKICAKRDVFYPSIRSDKYSLTPVEPATGKLVWQVSKDLEGEDGVCNPRRIITVTDTFSASDKADKLKDKQNKKDYDDCLADSKDLNFIATTSACRRISDRLAEYDNYKSYATVVEYPKEEGEEVKILLDNIPVMEYYRDGNDYLVFNINFVKYSKEDRYHKTIYYPRTIINPTSMAYFESNCAVPGFATSKCTIAPSTIEQFSGKYIPNQNKEWFAFAECYNTTTKGLSGHTIDKHHIGFTYWTNENVFSGSVKEGKLHIELDGKEYHKNVAFEDNDLKVYFLADNVAYIMDNEINIYYNTEYVQVTVNALYSKLLCGLCTKDQ